MYHHYRPTRLRTTSRARRQLQCVIVFCVLFLATAYLETHL